MFRYVQHLLMYLFSNRFSLAVAILDAWCNSFNERINRGGFKYFVPMCRLQTTYRYHQPMFKTHGHRTNWRKLAGALRMSRWYDLQSL